MSNEDPGNFAGNAAAFQAARLAEAGAAMALGNQYVKTMHETMGNTLQQWPDMDPKMNPSALSTAPGTAQFTVAANGQQFGPFTVEQLSQFAAQGVLTAQCLVWRQGMAGWQAAGSVPELARLFPNAGAPPPQSSTVGAPPPAPPVLPPSGVPDVPPSNAPVADAPENQGG